MCSEFLLLDNSNEAPPLRVPHAQLLKLVQVNVHSLLSPSDTNEHVIRPKLGIEPSSIPLHVRGNLCQRTT